MKKGVGHDPLVSSETAMPSERATGLTFSVMALIAAYLFRNSPVIAMILVAVAAGLAVVSFAAPRRLAPLNRAWFRLSIALSKIVAPVIMLLLFVLAFVPMGYFMRRSRDPLIRHRRPDRRSYWVERDTTAAQSMRNQF
jgi:phosphoglycerol transferase MdoB-like AlkP superfamily enzyme